MPASEVPDPPPKKKPSQNREYYDVYSPDFDQRAVSRRKTQAAKDKDPCYKEGQLSLKCLEYNFGDRDQCQSFFDNYRNCKKFWDKVVKIRTKKGDYPFLPDPCDRDEAKRQYYYLK